MKAVIPWPGQLYAPFFVCSVCKTAIDNERNTDGAYTQWFTPASRYWNPIKKEVYCCVEHSIGVEKCV